MYVSHRGMTFYLNTALMETSWELGFSRLCILDAFYLSHVLGEKDLISVSSEGV